MVSWTSSFSVCVCFNAKADLAILAFGHCVFFASFCFVLQLSHSLVCAFVCSFLQLHFVLVFVQFSAGGSVWVSFIPSSRLFLGLQV